MATHFCYLAESAADHQYHRIVSPRKEGSVGCPLPLALATFGSLCEHYSFVRGCLVGLPEELVPCPGCEPGRFSFSYTVFDSEGHMTSGSVYYQEQQSPNLPEFTFVAHRGVHYTVVVTITLPNGIEASRSLMIAPVIEDEGYEPSAEQSPRKSSSDRVDHIRENIRHHIPDESKINITKQEADNAIMLTQSDEEEVNGSTVVALENEPFHFDQKEWVGWWENQWARLYDEEYEAEQRYNQARADYFNQQFGEISEASVDQEDSDVEQEESDVEEQETDSDSWEIGSPRQQTEHLALKDHPFNHFHDCSQAAPQGKISVPLFPSAQIVEDITALDEILEELEDPIPPTKDQLLDPKNPEDRAELMRLYPELYAHKKEEQKTTAKARAECYVELARQW